MQAQGVQQSLLHQQSKRYPPTERTERTESSCREEPPTDGTDQHRSFVGGYGILPYPHTHIHEIASHRCKLRGCSSLCCTNKASSGTPTDSTDLHRCRRVWHPAVPTQSLTQPNHLWASVKSVGGSSTPEISVSICEICGRTSEGGVGMAGMPYPPIKITRS